VEAHDDAAAAALWSARLRAEYRPIGNIEGRFDAPIGIDVDRPTIDRMGVARKQAVVSIDPGSPVSSTFVTLPRPGYGTHGVQ
jgi:hypothetical protein